MMSMLRVDLGFGLDLGWTRDSPFETSSSTSLQFLPLPHIGIALLTFPLMSTGAPSILGPS